MGPDLLYEALLDAKRFSMFTATQRRFSGNPEKVLSSLAAALKAITSSWYRNQRIVQAWREAPWVPGIYSLVKFDLIARSFETRVVFDQTGIAEDDWEHLDEGWPIRYWEPLHKYLERESLSTGPLSGVAGSFHERVFYGILVIAS